MNLHTHLLLHYIIHTGNRSTKEICLLNQFYLFFVNLQRTMEMKVHSNPNRNII